MRILRLNDLYPYREKLPNLGDRALQIGFVELLEQFGDVQQQGPWKALATLTGARYARQSLKGQVWLDAQIQTILDEAPVRSRIEAMLARSLEFLLRDRFFMRPLDRFAEKHTGISWIDVVLPRLLRRHAMNRLKQAISDSDVVVFCAGGLLADHLVNYLPERLVQLYLAHRMGKPVAIANYSLALDKPQHRTLAAPVLRAMDVHLVREPRSSEALVALGVERDRIIKSMDSAFVLRAPPAKECQGLRIGVMIRGDRKVEFSAWAELLTQLKRRTGAQIHYLQNCFKYDPPVRTRLGTLCELDDDGEFRDLPAAMGELASMQLVITDRYHGLVFSMLSGVGLVALTGTTHKTRGLLEAVSYPLACQPALSSTNLQSVLHTCEQALADRISLGKCSADAGNRMKKHVKMDYVELLKRLRKRLPEV